MSMTGLVKFDIIFAFCRQVLPIFASRPPMALKFIVQVLLELCKGNKKNYTVSCVKDVFCDSWFVVPSTVYRHSKRSNNNPWNNSRDHFSLGQEVVYYILYNIVC